MTVTPLVALGAADNLPSDGIAAFQPQRREGAALLAAKGMGQDVSEADPADNSAVTSAVAAIPATRLDSTGLAAGALLHQLFNVYQHGSCIELTTPLT